MNQHGLLCTNQPGTPREHAVTRLTFEMFAAHWRSTGAHLSWNCLFMLPPWIKAWLEHFRTEAAARIYAVWSGDHLLGIAPLLCSGDTARLIGSANVCDYLDFIICPGMEREFFQRLVTHLRQEGIGRLELMPLRHDATVIRSFSALADHCGCRMTCTPEGVCYETGLPGTWNEYLSMLTRKQRHEVRRKMLRLEEEAGTVRYNAVTSKAALLKALEGFLALFALSRPDKAAFMTQSMAAYFRSLVGYCADDGIVRLGVLELDGTAVAAVLCFEYHDTVYLYNNGYDGRYRALNVGLASKVYSIQEAIRQGRKKYDFLKGGEQYKRHLGGKPVQLFRCDVALQ